MPAGVPAHGTRGRVKRKAGGVGNQDNFMLRNGSCTARFGIRKFDECVDAHVRQPYAASRVRNLLCCLR